MVKNSIECGDTEPFNGSSLPAASIACVLQTIIYLNLVKKTENLLTQNTLISGRIS